MTLEKLNRHKAKDALLQAPTGRSLERGLQWFRAPSTGTLGRWTATISRSMLYGCLFALPALIAKRNADPHRRPQIHPQNNPCVPQAAIRSPVL